MMSGLSISAGTGGHDLIRASVGHTSRREEEAAIAVQQMAETVAAGYEERLLTEIRGVNSSELDRLLAQPSPLDRFGRDKN